MNKLLLVLFGMALMFSLDVTILGRNGSLKRELSDARDSLRYESSWVKRYRSLYWKANGDLSRHKRNCNCACW